MSREIQHRGHTVKIDDDDISLPTLVINGQSVDITKVGEGYVSIRLPYDLPTSIETLSRRVIDEAGDFETSSGSEEA